MLKWLPIIVAKLLSHDIYETIVSNVNEHTVGNASVVRYYFLKFNVFVKKD